MHYRWSKDESFGPPSLVRIISANLYPTKKCCRFTSTKVGRSSYAVQKWYFVNWKIIMLIFRSDEAWPNVQIYFEYLFTELLDSNESCFFDQPNKLKVTSCFHLLFLTSLIWMKIFPLKLPWKILIISPVVITICFIFLSDYCHFLKSVTF